MDATATCDRRASTILPTAAHPPGPQPGRIERRHLIAQIEETSTSVIVLTAPAGSGKTTLLGQWARHGSEPVGWVALTPDDNTVDAFLDAIVRGISASREEFAETVEQQILRADAIDPGTRATTIVQVLTRETSPWTLILDDYHVITDPAIHGVLADLIAAMPGTCRLVVSSRDEPPLPLARFRVHELVSTLTIADLFATEAETRDLFASFGVLLTDAQLAYVYDTTAGWLLALHQIALASRTAPVEHAVHAVARLDAPGQVLHDFLVQEVLDRLSPGLRRFLLQISILDDITGEVCFAVTRNEMAHQLLDQARRAGLFLFDLDDSGTWLRFQSFFHDFLRHRLPLELAQSTVTNLHVAASHWYWEHGYAETAIVHAMRAEDWPFAAEMITSIAGDLFQHQRIDELGAVLDAFPSAIVLADPNLSTIQASSLVRSGLGAEADVYLAAAEAHWSERKLASGQALVEIIRGNEARIRDDISGLIGHSLTAIGLTTSESPLAGDDELTGIQPRFVSLGGTWLEHLPDMSPYLNLGYGLLRDGRIDAAGQLVQLAQEMYTATGVDMEGSPATSILAMVRLAEGKLGLSQILAHRVADGASHARPADRSLAAETLGAVLIERNQLAEAERTIQEGMAIRQRSSGLPHRVGLYLELAHLKWLQQHDAEAHSILDAAAEAAIAHRNHVAFETVDALRARFYIASGTLGYARQWSSLRSFTPETGIATASVIEILTYARLLIADGDAEHALEMLTRLTNRLAEDGRRHDLIQALAVRSLASLDLFRLDESVEALTDALAIGESGGYVRVFIDEGMPMIRLLKIVHRRGIAVQYVRQLLEAAGELPGEVVRVTHRDLVEPITAREIEVLGLVTLGLSNKEISDELYLSVATVKRHITNLYGKLGVASRMEAVQRARRLGLLSTEQSRDVAFAPKAEIVVH